MTKRRRINTSMKFESSKYYKIFVEQWAKLKVKMEVWILDSKFCFEIDGKSSFLIMLIFKSV